jgi:hypothetical protein
MTKISIANIGTASMSANEAGSFLPLAAQTAIAGKATVDAGKAKGANALALMVAGFASDAVAERPWNFEVKGSGDDIHEHVRMEGVAEFGGTEGAWRYNGNGGPSRVAQGAFKRALQNTFFNLPDNNPAVWTMASKAIPVALAIREEGMTATIVEGKLVLEGGHSPRAEAMRTAKDVSALAKVAKEETGTNRDAPQNAKGDSEAREATPAEICALAAKVARGVAKGETALCNAALSTLRAIAALVAANPEAFADI